MTKKKIKVLHFATGGFSGVTYMVMDLISAMQQHFDIDSLLVLRNKKNTQSKLADVASVNIPFKVVSGATHIQTIWQLYKICQQWQPDILVAHGFPEHLLGRWAGLWANIPTLIQVEHASQERYTTWRLWQSRFLSRYSQVAVGVSQGVQNVLNSQQLHCPTLTIHNGISTEKFSQYSYIKLANRPLDVIMVARFSKGKNHAVLFDALAILKEQGISLSLSLLGTGGRHLQQAKKQVEQLQLGSQVKFWGHSDKVAEELAKHKIFVMASYYEGLSLSVIEAMSAGCLVVGSDVVGVQELICHGTDGFLFNIYDKHELANILKDVAVNIENHQIMADMACKKAKKFYDKKVMAENYYQLFKNIEKKE